MTESKCHHIYSTCILVVLSSDDEEEGDGNITQSPTQMSLTAGSPQQKADDLEDVQVGLCTTFAPLFLHQPLTKVDIIEGL